MDRTSILNLEQGELGAYNSSCDDAMRSSSYLRFHGCGVQGSWRSRERSVAKAGKACLSTAIPQQSLWNNLISPFHLFFGQYQEFMTTSEGGQDLSVVDDELVQGFSLQTSQDHLHITSSTSPTSLYSLTRTD